MAEEPHNLEQLLDRFCSAAVGDDDQVTVRAVLVEIGTRSFGPLLLFAGAVLTSPLSGIPGIPTTMGALTLLISLQLLLRRDHFWLPRWVLDRSLSLANIRRAVKWLRPVARFVDRLLRPRLTRLVRGRAAYVIATVCALMAVAVPAMEVVPFSATLAGAALCAFGLSLTSRDGLVALVAFGFTAAVAAVVLVAVL